MHVISPKLLLVHLLQANKLTFYERWDNSILNLPFHVKTITFLMIGIIIVTGISVSSLILNQNQPAVAQQQQP